MVSVCKTALRIGLVTLIVLLSHAYAFAQFSSRSVSSTASLRTVGLDQMWRTQLEFDTTRGGPPNITQHISASSTQHVVEVTYPGGRAAYSDRDLDPFGKALGAKGALKKAKDFVAEWKRRNPEKGEPVLKENVVPDILIMAVSQRGLLQCLDGETGRNLWTVQVGSSRQPTTKAAANETRVAVVNGTTLYMLDRKDGRVIWERSMSQTPGAGPAMSENMVFVPMVNGYLQAFHIDEPRRPAATFFASGRCTVQPVVFRDEVAWPTDKGNMYVGNSEAAGIRFRIKANDAIRSAPTFRAGNKEFPGLIVFASSDGYIYAADSAKGDIAYRFSTGQPISQSPLIVREHVYAVTDTGTLYCIGADDAGEIWHSSGMKTILAANYDRLYCMNNANKIVSFDAKSGDIVGQAGLNDLGFAFSNNDSDRLLVGTTGGTLLCLRESRRRYPFIHGGAERKKQFSQALDNGAASAEATKPAANAAADGNPFGSDDAAEPKAEMPAEGDNPFGGDDAKKDGDAKKDKTPPADDNPFG